MEKQNESSNISTVSLVKCQTYDNSNIEPAIEKALELIGGIKSYVKPGDHVLLKINLLTVDTKVRQIVKGTLLLAAVLVSSRYASKKK
ncbi:MAG: hypothetical protein D4R88_04120 [Methanosarcinales archaeon]|nr:MAG: hypothetical protein D4R88_04120 [Methanosarcinales archaeon]